MDRAEMAAFSRTLSELMARKGMSQSDLARAVWGSTTDARGRDVARNRDRISHYVRGTQMPEAKTIKKLADVFGVPVVELCPALALPQGRATQAEVNLTTVGGRPDLALLTVNKMVPMSVAVQILALLANADATTVSGGGGAG